MNRRDYGRWPTLQWWVYVIIVIVILGAIWLLLGG